MTAKNSVTVNSKNECSDAHLIIESMCAEIPGLGANVSATIEHSV